MKNSHQVKIHEHLIKELYPALYNNNNNNNR